MTNTRGIAPGTEVRGHLNRPGTDFSGRVALLYTVAIHGFDVPAAKVQLSDGSYRYALLGDLTMARGEDAGDEPRTPDEFFAMLGDVEAEFEARVREIAPAAQIARKLSPAMRAALLTGKISRGSVVGRTGTIVALIDRALVTDTRTGAGHNRWTDLGREVAHELDETIPATAPDAQTTARHCPAGDSCTGAAFPGHPEHDVDDRGMRMGPGHVAPATIGRAWDAALAEDATRVTIAWRDNTTRETYARSIVDPVEFKQTARAIEAYDNLTRILTRPELREWLRLRVADPADLPYFVKHLFGASEDELDEDYAAICGPMA